MQQIGVVGVKVAIIALPSTENSKLITPPLLLGYVAALLEQQRHIVRIYDLAIAEQHALNKIADQVQAFRPHCIVIANETEEQAALVKRAFTNFQASIVVLNTNLRLPHSLQSLSLAQAVCDSPQLQDDQRVISVALDQLCGDLDLLPFPARHLMEIERYPMETKSGHFQTNVLIGHQSNTQMLLRNPRLIVSELRNIIHEYGVWHVRFDGLPLTANMLWLNDFLYDLAIARLDVKWEGIAHHQSLTPDLIGLMRRAGCEALTLEFDAIHVLDSQQERNTLLSIVSALHDHGIFAQGHILLDPRYSSIPAVVDMSATFGLDGASFSIQADAEASQLSEAASPAQIITMAQAQYRSSRDRQVLIKRHGHLFGSLIWRIGRIDSLGRFWQSQAPGHSQ